MYRLEARRVHGVETLFPPILSSSQNGDRRGRRTREYQIRRKEARYRVADDDVFAIGSVRGHYVTGILLQGT